MSSITNLMGKSLRYLRSNGIRPTIKKILRRVRGNNWLPVEEDSLYVQAPCKVAPHECWEMPEVCVPYEGKISVVIPAYNGAHELPALLAALRAQTQIDDLELVVVDSGSTDGTPELAEQYGAMVLRIRQEDFSHSYSRMLGATHATGDYLLFMTQDALPDRPDWLIRMLQPCIVSGAAAVSCYETPKPDADLLSHITVWNWTNVMSGGVDKLTALPEDTSCDSLRRSAQLSDNACLVKRSIFMELGGHRGAYAEDLDLGIRLLKAGYKLGILSSISVVHSHNRPPLYHFKRAIVDGVNIAKLFDDFTLDRLTGKEAVSRIFTAVCANRLYVRRLTGEGYSHPPYYFPSGFAEWTRHRYNDILMELKAMTQQQRNTLLLEDGEDLDPSVRGFIQDLWETYSGDFQFDGGLAAMQGRYIMHTVCPYLDDTVQTVDAEMRWSLSHLIWQYLGQSAGYAIAAAYLNPKNTDQRITDIVNQYSVGV